MTNEEFSNEFDTLVSDAMLASNSSYGSLGFDEYEKSVFLTEAQEKVVTSLYKGTLTGDSFEKTEELRRYLSNLVKTHTSTTEVNKEGVTENSHFFSIPSDVLFITYEAVKSNDTKLECAKGSILEVVPVTQDELYKTIRNPFRMPNKRRVLRLDINSSNIEEGVVELISLYSISEYILRYLARPKPIILINLPDGLTINKLKEETECELNPAIHRMILEMAVSLAIKSRVNAGK